MLSATGGVGPGTDLFRVLQEAQAQAMQMADKLLRICVQQAIQDSSVGARVDVTA